jgi:hypothetical protein
MTNDDWITRLDIMCDKVLQKIIHLTDDDLLIWKHASVGTDCKYVAHYGEITLRLSCDTQELFIEDEQVEVSKNVVCALCWRVPSQQRRQELKRYAEKMEEYDRLLDKRPPK